MDATMPIWCGLVAIAYAIFAGLSRIADAIRYRTVDVKFNDPIRVVHQGPEHGSR
jgi:hypothetical protein